MDQRLSLITLGVNNLNESRHFYEQGLGWKPSSLSNENICFIPLNGIVLALYPRALLAEDACLREASANYQPGTFGGIALAYNAPTKDAVDEVLALAKKAGAKILKPAEMVFWGGYSGYFADPNGYPWEVAWNPGFTIEANGDISIPA